jgi:thiamine transporter
MLCEGAIFVALAFVLSFIKAFELPQGGSISLVMLPLLVYAVRWGTPAGVLAGVVFGLLHMLMDGAYAWGWQSMLLDYLVAFGALGLAGLGRSKKGGIFWGSLIGCFARFVVHFISGVTIYRLATGETGTVFGLSTTSAGLYSLLYNGWYMLPSTVFCLLIFALLYKPLRKYLTGADLRTA